MWQIPLTFVAVSVVTGATTVTALDYFLGTPNTPPNPPPARQYPAAFRGTR